MMYRAVEASLNDFPHPDQSLQKTLNILGTQILSMSDTSTMEGHRLSIYCNLRSFPRPKFAIGEYVTFYIAEKGGVDFDKRYRGIIIGMAYHQKPEDLKPGWWYDILPDAAPGQHECLHQGMISDRAPIWECPEFKHLTEDTKKLLESFLDNFEENHGPLFPPEEEAV